MELTDEEKTIIRTQIKLNNITEKLNSAIKERDGLLAKENITANNNKIAIVNNYKTQIEDLQIQKERAEKDYKELLI